MSVKINSPFCLLGEQNPILNIIDVLSLNLQNLLVTSTLAISTDPPPAAMSNPEEPNSVEPEKETEVGSLQEEISVANGIETTEEIKDEIMAEVEEGNGDSDLNDDMTIDADAVEAKTEAPNPIINPNSNL